MNRWLVELVRRRGDLLLALVCAIVTVAIWASEPTLHTPGGTAVTVSSLVGACLLVWRRRAPVLVPALVYISLIPSFLLERDVVLVSAQLILFLAIYTTIRAAGSLRQVGVRIAVCFAGVVPVVIAVNGNVALAVVQAAAITGVLAAIALTANSAVAERRRLTTEADRASAAAEQREREAVAAERNRIARDLHDAVTHSITVSILQARGGRKVLDRDPTAARAAFDTIESTSEQALVEMRRMLGVLRDGTTAGEDNHASSGVTPPATLRQLDALLAAVPAPITVDLDVTGDLHAVPPSVDTTAFRILQEAVTNVIKHSNARRIDVAVTVQPDALSLRVRDNGASRAADSPAGFGIIGMRERVSAFGGSLSAEPLPGAGFLVSARLPLRDTT